jgi:Flp pilus assembly protein TadG
VVSALIRRLWRDRAGMSLVEFAIMMPVLVLLLLGGTEIARYILLNQQLDRLSTTTADLVAQEDGVTSADLNNIFDAALNITWPFNMRTSGAVVVSSVGQQGGQARVLWQRTCPGNGCSGSGTNSYASRIGTQGATATMPTGFTVAATDNVIVAEVFYSFTPFFWRQMPAGTIYHRALTRPRLSNLTTID